MGSPIRFRVPRRVNLEVIDEGFAEARRAYDLAENGCPRVRWAMVVSVRQILRTTYRRAGLVPGGEA